MRKALVIGIAALALIAFSGFVVAFSPSIQVTVSPTAASLGEIIGIDITASSIYDFTVDVELDGCLSSFDPLHYELKAGTHSIHIDAQVVEAKGSTNGVLPPPYQAAITASLTDSTISVSDTTYVDIRAFGGFDKRACHCEDLGDGDGIIETNELWVWYCQIQISRANFFFSFPYVDATVSDRFGGEFGVQDDHVDNDQDGLIDEELKNGAFDDDGDGVYNEDVAGPIIPTDEHALSDPSYGSVEVTTKGKSNKATLKWTGISPPANMTILIKFVMFTDKNPAGKQEFTSPGEYCLNSGAVFKFRDSRGKQFSVVTEPIWVTVLKSDGNHLGKNAHKH